MDQTKGPAGEQESPPPDTKTFLRIFPTVSLPMFLALTDQSIVTTSLPAIAGLLGAVEQISLIVIGYMIAATIAAPVYGWLGDGYGRRRLLLVALCIFACAAGLCAFATNVPMLIAGRILQGFGGGGLMALSHALIGEVVAPRNRVRYQGYFATLGVTSNGMGPVIGGVLSEYFGWRAIFLFSMPLAILAFFLVRRLPNSTPAAKPQRFDYGGLILFAVFIVSLLSLLHFIQRFDGVRWMTLGALASVAATSLYALLKLEARQSHPLLPVDLFRNATTWRSVALAACYSAILLSLLTFVPIYLRVMHDMTPSEIGLLVGPMTICIGAGSIITGRIVSRTGWTAIMPSCGLALATIGLVCIAFLSADLRPLQLSGLLAVMAFFLGTIMPVAQVTVQVAAGASRLGAAAAAIQYSRTLGAALGTAIITTILFASLTRGSEEVLQLFQAVLLRGPEVLDALAPERMLEAQSHFARSFRFSMLGIAGFAFLGTILVWTMPLRRI